MAKAAEERKNGEYKTARMKADNCKFGRAELKGKLERILSSPFVMGGTNGWEERAKGQGKIERQSSMTRASKQEENMKRWESLSYAYTHAASVLRLTHGGGDGSVWIAGSKRDE